MLSVKWVLVSAVLSILWYRDVNACSCLQRSHPQTYACAADFIIVARAKTVQLHPKKYLNVYKVIVKKEFKVSEAAKLALKSGRLYTPSDSAACGTRLELGKTYLIIGSLSRGKATIHLCNYIEPWKSIPARMRKGFRLLYGMGCDCKIADCPGYGRPCPVVPDNDTCQLTSYCQNTNSICTRHPGGKCAWLKNKSCEQTRHTNSVEVLP